MQQEIFSNRALISVELANSFWPRKLSAAPIGFSFQCETLFKALVEHFIPRLQVVDEKEAVGFPRRLFIQLVELLLWQQGAQLLHHGVQLVLVAQPPAAEELHVHPHRCSDEPQLLRASPRCLSACADPCQGAVRLVQLRRVSKVVDDYKQVQLRRQHLPAAQDAHHGGAQQHVRVAALVRRAGRPRVVHLVEALHGLVLVVLAALQQVMRGHGAAVVGNVVAALAVGEDLDPLNETGRVRVASVFLTLKAILIDSGSMNEVPLVRGMRQTLEVAGEKELSELGKYL